MPIQIILYNILYLLLLVVLFPFLVLAALLSDKYRSGFFNRFGIIPQAFAKKVKGFKNIWLHAASAGEVKSVLPLAEELKKKYPSANIIFTTTGINGQRMLNKVSKDVAACYLPLDLYFLVRPLVKLIKPEMLVVAETEYWPSLFYLAKKEGAKIVIVNGRFSTKAVKRYKVISYLTRKLFALVDSFAMRSQEEAEVLVSFGVERKKIIIPGDLKYEKPLIDEVKKTALINALVPVLKEKVAVYGSVHYKEAGDIFGSFRKIKERTPGISLILAPRFLEEIPFFIQFIEKEGFKYVKRSNPGKDKVDIVILDSFGELSYAYGLCSVAFVGGSLADGIGGHNVLEPVYLGKPVFFGPYGFNFRDMEEEVKINLVGFMVKDASDLADKIHDFLGDAGMLSNIEKASAVLLEKRKGSLLKTLELL